jgi:hypothetical protein
MIQDQEDDPSSEILFGNPNLEKFLGIIGINDDDEFKSELREIFMGAGGDLNVAVNHYYASDVCLRKEERDAAEKKQLQEQNLKLLEQRQLEELKHIIQKQQQEKEENEKPLPTKEQIQQEQAQELQLLVLLTQIDDEIQLQQEEEDIRRRYQEDGEERKVPTNEIEIVETQKTKRNKPAEHQNRALANAAKRKREEGNHPNTENIENFFVKKRKPT